MLHAICDAGLNQSMLSPAKFGYSISLLTPKGYWLGVTRFYIIGPEERLMNRKAVIAAIALIGSGLFPVTGQQTPALALFTAAQADAGRVAYENSCGRCHTYTLLGRKGEEGELPALTSLPEPFLKFIGPRKRVPALIGKSFAM